MIESFRHEALLYRDEDEFVLETLAYVRRGLALEQPALVLVRDDRIRLLRDALASEADRVQFRAVEELGRNPARIIPLWIDYIEQFAASGRAVCGVCEGFWPDATPAELQEIDAHEVVLNSAFAEGPAWSLLCPHDLHATDQVAVERARTTHRHITEGGTSYSNPAFQERTAFSTTLAPPPRNARRALFDIGDLQTLRDGVREDARNAGLDPHEEDRVVTALAELAANSVRHGGGLGALLVWEGAGGLVLQVDDFGHITDPLAGRLRPYARPGAQSGAGLWVVNNTCDLVQIHSTEAGTSVRASVRRHGGT